MTACMNPQSTRRQAMAGAAVAALAPFTELSAMSSALSSTLSRSSLRFSSFPDALHSERPSADRADKMGLYGRFIGDWEMEAVVHAEDGTTHAARGEIHFGWVLEGRAIQDVWILPGFFPARRSESTTPGSMRGISCGATP
jgi:hypothetical protein